MSKKLTLPILLCCLIYMVLFPQVTADCVRQTLVLWYQNVLPALLPALLIVHLLLSGSKTRLNPDLFCLFIGLFCGFPLGCQCVCESVQKGQLSKEKGTLYAAAFNQFSPVFLSSYVASSMLELPLQTVLAILYASNFLLFIPIYKLMGQKKQTFIHKEMNGSGQKGQSFFAILDNAIIKSSDTLVKIGGYMLICSLLRTILQTLIPNKVILIVLAGCLETTSGVAYATANCANRELMRTLVFAFTAFGGLCGFLQVSRPLEDAGLKKHFYVGYKFAAGILSALLFSVTNIL